MAHNVGLTYGGQRLRVWGTRGDTSDSDGDEYFDRAGSSIATWNPPDTDADGINTIFNTWEAGGSEAGLNYQLAVSHATGDFFVDVFDRDITYRVDRWQIPGWNINTSPLFMDANTACKHVAVGDGFVVAVCNKYDLSAGHRVSIETTVFDLTGAVLNQWSFPAPDDGFGNVDQLDDFSGSYVANGAVYFDYLQESSSGDHFVATVDLATGALALLFDISNVDVAVAALDSNWDPGSTSNPAISLGGQAYAIVVLGTDVVVVGPGGAMVRADAAGTPVWWTPAHGDHSVLPASGSPLSYDDGWQGACPSGQSSIFVVRQNEAKADEFSEAGAYLGTIVLNAEVMRHIWLVTG